MKKTMSFLAVTLFGLSAFGNAFEGNNKDGKIITGGAGNPYYSGTAPEIENNAGEDTDFITERSRCANAAVDWVVNMPRQYGGSGGSAEYIGKAVRRNLNEEKTKRLFYVRQYQQPDGLASSGDLMEVYTFFDGESHSDYVRVLYNVSNDCELKEATYSTSLEIE